MFGNLVPLGAVLLAAVFIQAGNGTLQSLLPMRLALVDASVLDTGLIAMGYALGFMVGCVVAPRLIRAVGHIRAYAAFAATTAATLLFFQIAVVPLLWVGLRMLTGLCLAGLFTVADSWVNSRTPTEIRGQVLAIYAIIVTVAIGASQLLLSLDDPLSPTLIMVISGLFSLAVVPVALTRSESPPTPQVVTVSIARLYALAPAAAVGAFVVGVMNASLVNVVPYFLTSNGAAAATVAIVMMSLQGGKLVAQWPLGRVSDRVDRRHVILAGCAVIILTTLFAALSAPGEGEGLRDAEGLPLRAELWLAFGVLGATCLTLYPLCAAHAHDHASPDDAVTVSSTLLFTWAAGAVVGPPLCTLLMKPFGGSAIFWFVGGCALVLALFIVWRITRRAPVPVADRDVFVEVPATSPIASELDPRAEPDRAAQTGD